MDQAQARANVDVNTLANCLVQTEDGNSILVSALWKNQTAVLIFLRHFGCIFCRQHAKQVWADRAHYERTGAKIIFISNGAAYMIKGFKEELGITSAPIFTDPSLDAFKAVGFKRGFKASLGITAIGNAIKALGQGHRQGNVFGKDQGDLWQLGGLVVVKQDETVPYVFISQAAGDFAPAGFEEESLTETKE